MKAKAWSSLHTHGFAVGRLALRVLVHEGVVHCLRAGKQQILLLDRSPIRIALSCNTLNS